jgi:hypothetical protein
VPHFPMLSLSQWVVAGCFAGPTSNGGAAPASNGFDSSANGWELAIVPTQDSNSQKVMLSYGWHAFHKPVLVSTSCILVASRGRTTPVPSEISPV